jgi:hypothetical protein
MDIINNITYLINRDLSYTLLSANNSVTNFTIDDKVTSIAENAFKECILTKIIIPKSVKNIEHGVFSGCVNLTSVIFEKEIKLYSIQSETFFNCSNLESIIIPKSVKYIEDKAFTNCYNLQSVEFEHKSKLEIISSSFTNCYKLMSITIPDNVMYITSEGFTKDPTNNPNPDSILPKTIINYSIKCKYKLVEHLVYTNNSLTLPLVSDKSYNTKFCLNDIIRRIGILCSLYNFHNLDHILISLKRIAYLNISENYENYENNIKNYLQSLESPLANVIKTLVKVLDVRGFGDLGTMIVRNTGIVTEYNIKDIFYHLFHKIDEIVSYIDIIKPIESRYTIDIEQPFVEVVRKLTVIKEMQDLRSNNINNIFIKSNLRFLQCINNSTTPDDINYIQKLFTRMYYPII